MHVASVTLDEVLRAAARRAASLVPETAGYLALAIGDASARLPYRLDDELVTLTTEGTVRVARGRVAVPPEEGARLLRDLLRRLLSVSAGTMPGLAQAAVARPETASDAVIGAIEAALIPVNRAAARRSLARLARDTARARDAGRLAGGAPAPAPAPAAAAAPAPRAATPLPGPEVAAAAPVASPPAPVEAAYEEPDVLVTTPSVPIVVVAASDDAWSVAASDDACLGTGRGPDAAPAEEPATPFRPELARARRVVTPAPEEVTHRLALPVDVEPLADSTADATTIDPDVVAVAESAGAGDERIGDEATDGERHALDADALPIAGPQGDAQVEPGAAVEVVDGLDAHPIEVGKPEEPAVEHAADVAIAADAAVARDEELHPDGVPAEDLPVDASPPSAIEASPPGPAAVEAAPMSGLDRAARALEDALRSGALATATAPVRIAPQAPLQRRPWQAELAPATHSDVDALLARFRPSEAAGDATAMRRDLKHLVGIDATQLPPRVTERAR